MQETSDTGALTKQTHIPTSLTRACWVVRQSQSRVHCFDIVNYTREKCTNTFEDTQIKRHRLRSYVQLTLKV